MSTSGAELIRRLPLDIDLDTPVIRLSGIEREVIAILHALCQSEVKILILDEPTSTLTRVEKEQLFTLMSSLKSSGVSIIYITHRLEEVHEIADRFTVFRGGRRVATMDAAEANAQQVSITRLMLEQDPGDLYPFKNSARVLSDLYEVPHLSVDSLTRKGAFERVSLDARAGEILGIFGLVGSGIEEFAKALFGAVKVSSGQIRIDGNTVELDEPRIALRQGIYLVPGDRRAEGLILGDSVNFNTTLAHLSRASWPTGLLRLTENRREVASLAGRVDLQPQAISQSAGAFSGGNQQKIVIAKGLFRQAGIYLFVEPTVGVDIGARSKLYALIRELSATATVVVLSSDCDEAHGLGDRVCAFYRGHMVLAPSGDIDRDTLLQYGIAGRVQ